MKRLFIVVILTLAINSVFSTDIDTLFNSANEAYNNEMYTNAIENYLQIVDAGYESYALYFNLGNACFKLGDIPSAILYYEKAKKLNPNVANTNIVDKIEPVPELFFWQWWRSIYNLFDANTWAKISVGGFILFFVLLAFYLLSKLLFIRKTAFYTGLTILFFTIFTFIIASQKYDVSKNQNEAIVFTPTITVKSSPNQNSVDLFVIHEGSKVSIIETVGNWCEIKIANGSVGWLPVDALKNI